MEKFSIVTHLTPKEYAKLMFLGLYKKPAFMLATLLGLYFAATILLDYLNIIDWYADTPIFEIICGIFLLLAPTLIVIISLKQFMSNPSFRNNITYTFDDYGIATQGLTFKSEVSWTHIIKQRELGKFLILYHNNKFGNFIDKTKLTTTQLQFIKSKAGQK